MSLLDQVLVAGLPMVPKPLVRQVASRYVAGETMEDMVRVVRELNRQGMLATVDLLGEFISRRAEAEAAAQEYHAILQTIQAETLQANVSIKLSQMGLLLDKQLCGQIMHELVETAAGLGNFVRIDMEDSACTDDTIALYLKLREKFSNVGIVLQACLRRTMVDTRRILSAGAGHFRLCKGIYIEPRTIAYRDRELVRQNYGWVLDTMLRACAEGQAGASDAQKAYVGIATHDERLVWKAFRLIDYYGLKPEQYEFQMLLGVDPELRQLILNAGHRLRVYVPFGRQWYAYSVRRLKENPRIARYVLQSMVTGV